MTIAKFVSILFTVVLSALPEALAQQPLPAVPLPANGMKLDVVVDTKSGQPVTNLHQQDFTVLDNKTPRPITSFRVMSAAEEPVHVILFLDAVNTPYQMLAYMREGTEKFLKEKEGTLAYPTSVAVLTDDGAQIENTFTTDGNTLSDALKHHQVGLREINRASDWSGPERLDICLNAFHQILNYAGNLPGRKLILWLSPGWPLVSGPRIYLSEKDEDRIFRDIESVSSQMWQQNITLYNINPIGVGESLNHTDYYQSFLNGVAKPSQASLGNLGLQVFAIHSGGVAIESNSDVTGNIRTCLADAQSWYEIIYDPLPGDKPNEYHRIEVKLDQRNLIARARDSYYANPQALDPKH
jgi:VWFA-related protein